MTTPEILPRALAVGRLEAVLEQALAPETLDWWLSQKRDAGDVTAVERAFPALVRRVGAEPLVEPTDGARLLQSEGFLIDLAAWRRADAAGALLIDTCLQAGADAALVRRLYDQGDMNERTIVLRSLATLEPRPVVLDLLGEGQRSNNQEHIEAAFCDSDLVARVLDEADFNRAILKMAFTDVPEWRVLRGLNRANAELSTVLQDFATEREAAGRPVWNGTLPFISRAPVEGTVARVIGHLEHGDDNQRRRAAESIAALRDPSLVRFVEERIEREPREEIKNRLQEALVQLSH